jgi:hypothetical protein
MLAGVEERLARFESEFAASHVRFSPYPLDIPPEDLDYVDLLHVRNGAPVAAEIADRLCELLDDLGDVRCVDTEEETS